MSESAQTEAFRDSKIRVRFAPSPTGDLHVGSVRTALFNYLFARHSSGKFLLRIEDTDRERSTPEAIRVILDGLAWLGIDPDEEPVYQSARSEKHIQAAEELLAKGRAYRCFCDPETIAEIRKKSYTYDRRCLNLSQDEIDARIAEGQDYALRLKIPEGDISFKDGAHGEIKVSSREIEDFVLLRRNVTPTYMLAVVVDDSDMGITHIIRGDDHISNTPKQILIYRGLDRKPPQFVHVPLILGTDKSRLSKRHGATSIIAYRDMGYLPETIVNYLGLLGWSPGDDREIITREELIDLFSISGIQPKNAVFDESKLRWLNGQHLGRTEFADVADRLEQVAREAIVTGVLSEMPERAAIEKAWNLVKNRAFFYNELFVDFGYMFQDPLNYDPKGVKKHFMKDGAVDRIDRLVSDFDKLEPFDVSGIEGLLRSKADEWEVGTGKLIHPVRLACSGVTGGPGLFEMLEALGKETVVRRLKKTVEWLKSNPP